jgi:hypothetical protein
MPSRLPVYHPGLDEYALLSPEQADHAAAQGWVKVEHRLSEKAGEPSEPEKKATATAPPTLGDPRRHRELASDPTEEG